VLKPFVGLGLLLASFGAAAEGVVAPTCSSLAWDAVTTYTDGTPVPAGTVTEYRVYWQQTKTPVPVPGTTIPSASVAGNVTSVSCSGLAKGQWYAWATAVSANGESGVSAMLPFVIGVLAPPTNLRVGP
jgi:hypothetical protein